MMEQVQRPQKEGKVTIWGSDREGGSGRFQSRRFERPMFHRHIDRDGGSRRGELQL